MSAWFYGIEVHWYQCRRYWEDSVNGVMGYHICTRWRFHFGVCRCDCGKGPMFKTGSTPWSLRRR